MVLYQGIGFEIADKVFSDGGTPRRLEAAIDQAAVTARVELVPFPSVQDREFFCSPLAMHESPL